MPPCRRARGNGTGCVPAGARVPI